MSEDSAATGEKLTSHNEKSKKFQADIVYPNVVKFIILHLGFLYGWYLQIYFSGLKTFIFTYALVIVGGLGITAGAHRLWTHRSYKAKLPLRIFLCICNCMAGQNDLYTWSRDHRVHHKYSETDADPHNINRGFFFAHMGWLMCKKHPDVANIGKNVPVSDLLDDPVIRFQKRFYVPLFLLWGYVVPTLIPVLFWKESAWNAFFICGMVRYVIGLHGTWLVNSAAHMWGGKPLDKNIRASENRFVSAIALGEGWHNYHHVFPWDYTTSEMGFQLNITRVFIDFMAHIGQAYDLKIAHPTLSMNRKLKTGDGTRLESYGSDKM